MLNINIKTTGVELTAEISNYLNKKIEPLNKFVKESDNEAHAQIEIGKETNHHKAGKIFFTEINFRINGKDFRARANGDSLMSSMDDAKDIALKLAREDKDKKKKKIK